MTGSSIVRDRFPYWHRRLLVVPASTIDGSVEADVWCRSDGAETQFRRNTQTDDLSWWTSGNTGSRPRGSSDGPGAL